MVRIDRNFHLRRRRLAYARARPRSLFGRYGTSTWQTGSIPFFNGTRLTEDNTNLFWDSTNHRLGIGSTTPWSRFSITGSDTSATTPALAAADSNNKLIFNVMDNGNVGIGTTSPSTTWAVSGNAYITGGEGLGVLNTTAGTLQTSGLIAGGSTLTLAGTTGTTTIASGQGFTIGGTQFVLQQGSGYIGIGVSNPGMPLFVNGGSGQGTPSVLAGTIAEFQSNSCASCGGHVAIIGGTTGTAALDFGSSAAQNRGQLVWNNTGANFYLSGGNVGIGTSTPYSRLEIWGPDTASTSAFSVVNNASTTVFAVYDSGNSTYSGSIFQSSDERLKTDVTPLDASSSLAAIEALNPVSYVRLDQPASGENLGFLAQEVGATFPELVSTTSATALTPGGTLTLNYEGLIAPIVGAIKAIATDIASLEATVAGFAKSFTSHQVTTDKLCLTDAGGTTCYTRAQLNAVIPGTPQPAAQGSTIITVSSSDAATLSSATTTPTTAVPTTLTATAASTPTSTTATSDTSTTDAAQQGSATAPTTSTADTGATTPTTSTDTSGATTGSTDTTSAPTTDTAVPADTSSSNSPADTTSSTATTNTTTSTSGTGGGTGDTTAPPTTPAPAAAPSS